MKPSDLLLARFIMVVWGLNFPMGKIAVTEFPPMLMIGIRFAITAAVLVPIYGLPKGKMLAVAGIGVTLGLIHFGLMFTGLKGIDASAAAITVQTQVAFSAILTAFIFKDYLGWRRALGMALAFAGVVLIAGAPSFDGSLLALGLVIAGSFVWSVANIQIKLLGEIDPYQLNGGIALCAAPLQVVASFIYEEGQVAAMSDASWEGWLSILYMAFAVTIIGYGRWYVLIGRYPVNQVMPFTLLVPIIGVGSSVAVLGERFTAEMTLGAALTVIGVAIIVLRRPQAADPRPPRA